MLHLCIHNPWPHELMVQIPSDREIYVVVDHQRGLLHCMAGMHDLSPALFPPLPFSNLISLLNPSLSMGLRCVN